MLSFLGINLSTLIVGAIVFLIVGLVIRKMILDKKNHKSSCGGGCANCPSAGLCHRN